MMALEEVGRAAETGNLIVFISCNLRREMHNCIKRTLVMRKTPLHQSKSVEGCFVGYAERQI